MAKTLCVFTPLHNEQPPANGAYQGFRGDNHPVLVFETDEATDIAAVFRSVLPRSYGGGGLTIRIHFLSEGTTGDVRWAASIERHAVGAFDFDADGFAAAVLATQAVDSISGESAVAEIALTDGAQIDSLAAGEPFRLKVERVASDALDTSIDWIQLLIVEVFEP